VSDLSYAAFDADNHYYEALDAFTRYVDPRMQPRCVQWCEINGRKYHVVGGIVSHAVVNPTFDPIAKAGAMHDYFRGNPNKLQPYEFLREREPIPAEYRDRDARIAKLDEFGLEAVWLFPTLGILYEELIKHDIEAVTTLFSAFNRWLDDDWGYRRAGRLFAVPYIPLLDPDAAADELRRVVDAGAIAVNVRSAAVPVPGGHRSPFDPVYDGFWGLAAEAGIAVTTHAGIEGYDAIVQMWEPGGSESSLFRSPLRGIVTKGRAVSDFLGAAVCHKVFERFPDLRMAVVENGASWAPDLRHRLDDAANRNPGYFEHHPRDVFGAHVWITPFWEDDIGALIEEVRVDRLLLGSDWPHAEGTRAPVDFVTDSLAGLPDETVRRIGRDNALEVLATTLA
jgi:predicted TIM-barrel fold metal-dependent hydrolase